VQRHRHSPQDARRIPQETRAQPDLRRYWPSLRDRTCRLKQEVLPQPRNRRLARRSPSMCSRHRRNHGRGHLRAKLPTQMNRRDSVDCRNCRRAGVPEKTPLRKARTRSPNPLGHLRNTQSFPESSSKHCKAWWGEQLKICRQQSLHQELPRHPMVANPKILRTQKRLFLGVPQTQRALPCSYLSTRQDRTIELRPLCRPQQIFLRARHPPMKKNRRLRPLPSC